MANRQVNVNCGVSPPALTGDSVALGSIYADAGDTLTIVLDDDSGLEGFVTFDPPESVSHFRLASYGVRSEGIDIQPDTPRGSYALTFQHPSTGQLRIPITVGSVIDVTVLHTSSGCTLLGPTVAQEHGDGDYIVQAHRFDLIRFNLSSTDPDVKWDAPPLIWSSPEQCKAMSVERVSDTLFYVGDDGSTGGVFAFTLDIDRVTLTGRVHCKDDPSILNDNPP